jgi:hypothetical protein
MPCPFYGFAAAHEAQTLVPTQGNGCPLYSPDAVPCHMQMSGQAPDLDTCPHAAAMPWRVDTLRGYRVWQPGELMHNQMHNQNEALQHLTTANDHIDAALDALHAHHAPHRILARAHMLMHELAELWLEIDRLTDRT